MKTRTMVKKRAVTKKPSPTNKAAKADAATKSKSAASRKVPAKKPSAAKTTIATDSVPALAAALRIIESEADIRAGVAALRGLCPHFRVMHDLAGDPPLRRRQSGFEGLARIIVGQQVSIASANAIWGRFATAVAPAGTPMQARHVLAASDDTLRGAGLSRPKIRTLRAIADAVAAGLDLEGLHGRTDEEVHADLTAISGVGPWTADIFLMFCLGRADTFAPGDLALQEAARMVLALDTRPDKVAVAAIAERWRPWRGVAARMLWAYYAVAKKAQQSGVPV